MYAKWPIAGKVDEVLLKSSSYFMDAVHKFRLRLKTLMTKVHIYLLLFTFFQFIILAKIRKILKCILNMSMCGLNITNKCFICKRLCHYSNKQWVENCKIEYETDSCII